MTGTVKQIKWARDIIAEAYAACDLAEANYNRYYQGAVSFAAKMAAHGKQVDISARTETIAGYNLDDVAEVRAIIDDAVSRVDSADEVINRRNLFSQRRTEAAIREMARNRKSK